MGKYLGLDSSTQSLSALVIDTDANQVVYEKSVNFGKDLPGYNCQDGFLGNKDQKIRHSDPLMWCAAMDLLFTRMKEDNFDFSEIDCISGSGQQHGSVYLKESFLNCNWQDAETLADTVKPLLSRQTSPIWMDSSTSEECKEIAEAVGGNDVVRQKSGSITIERFTGSQIRKFYKDSPADYDNTAIIHLVSSFLASLLAGKSVGIDLGDGSGMNLLNLETAAWDKELIDATVPGLADKLPPVVSSDTVAGNISEYFVNKYGFSPECKINVWSGDNPNSLVGLGASETGTVVISLGTSDTFMAAFDKPVTDPNGFGHVFYNPAGGYMCLICFKNGSLAREQVKDEFGISWEQFDKGSFESTPPGNENNVMIPFYSPEITPKTSDSRIEFDGDEEFVQRKSYAKAVRGICESQITNMLFHTSWIDTKITKIRLTGGASKCDGICQVIADIFQAPLERFSVSNSAGLGSAIRAAHADNCGSWDQLTNSFLSSSKNVIFEPDSSTIDTYNNFKEAYQALLKS